MITWVRCTSTFHRHSAAGPGASNGAGISRHKLTRGRSPSIHGHYGCRIIKLHHPAFRNYCGSRVRSSHLMVSSAGQPQQGRSIASPIVITCTQMSDELPHASSLSRRYGDRTGIASATTRMATSSMAHYRAASIILRGHSSGCRYRNIKPDELIGRATGQQGRRFCISRR